ncbi:MAG: T9SS type A sorting domain-containing protein [Salinivirgaceae bacterium]|nr:T9SS type A sorting domain-containing protein [Salinivirgaceae bacterium]
MKRTKFLQLFAIVAIVCSVSILNAQNRSLQFDGSNDKVVVPNHSDFDFTTEFSLEAWIYAENWKDQAWQGSLINKDGDYDGAQRGFNMRAGADGRLEGTVTPGWEGATTGSVMKEKKWNHVAMVYKEGEMWLYINGTLQAYKAGLPNPINTSPFDLIIGECPGFTGRVWDGRIDEVRIWNLARNGEQIQQNMDVDLIGTETGLIAYYTFDEEDTSGTLTDITGNGHDGTLTNFDTYTWTDGYELSSDDMALTGILNPGNSPTWSNAERLQIEVKNMAFNAVSQFNINVECNDQVFTETVETTIDPWESYTYTFNKFLALADEDEVTVKAYISWEADTDNSNDTLELSFVKTNTIRLMNGVQHNFGDQGQLHSNSLTLPDDNSKYDSLLLHIDLACPTYGCDPWDQMGNVKIKKDGVEYEIGRFITPYGKACGPWTIDVTDFRQILTGSVEVQSFIQVWGASGWLLTVDLEYKEGEVEKPFTQIVPLYELERQVYGDPDISYDLAEQFVSIPENAQNAHIRMTNTGHGQANTNNAAEFMAADHHMWVNGTDMFTHHLWKDDCDQNTCSPQSGTWQYARAGWCPGQEVIPFWMDLSEVLTAGDEMIFDYVLEDYTNLLNTGYNDGSHTEPFYRIYSYLFMESDEPFGDFIDMEVSAVSAVPVNEDNGVYDLTFELRNNGNVTLDGYELNTSINNGVVSNYQVSTTVIPGGIETYTLENVDLDENIDNHIVGFVSVAGDAIMSNNSNGLIIESGNSIFENINLLDASIFPNPTNGMLNIKVLNSNEKVKVMVSDLSGKIILRDSFITETKLNLSSLQKGLYLIQLKSNSGVAVHKIEVK